MKNDLVDVNVLVALAVTHHEHHEQATRWFATAPKFATTPITEMALVRLLMNPKVAGRPVSLDEARTVLRAIRARSGATFLADATSLADARAITTHITGTKQVTDAHLLNLAVANGHRLATLDRHLWESLPPRHRHHVHVLE